MERKIPFVLALTGASGSVYGLRMLQFFVSAGEPVDLLISKGALQVMQEEMDLHFGNNILPGILKHLALPQTDAVVLHNLENYGATVASGSYRTRGMAIVPCSLGTLGGIASGLTQNLILRAATVTLKEKRPLLILLREMPFGHIQLKQMLALSEAGATVACAAPAFYHRPQSIGDMIDFVVGRALDQLGYDNQLFKRWKEDAAPLALPVVSK